MKKNKIVYILIGLIFLIILFIISQEKFFKENKKEPKTNIVLFCNYFETECANFVLNVFPTINNRYVKTNDLTIVFKQLPSIEDSNSVLASLAALCAEEQDRFWEYSEVLFRNQEILNKGFYLETAGRLNLKIDQFNLCLNNQQGLKQIDLDKNLASEERIEKAPAILVNGVLFTGEINYHNINKEIQKNLIGNNLL